MLQSTLQSVIYGETNDKPRLEYAYFCKLFFLTFLGGAPVIIQPNNTNGTKPPKKDGIISQTLSFCVLAISVVAAISF